MLIILTERVAFFTLHTVLNYIWLAYKQKLVLCVPEGLNKRWGVLFGWLIGLVGVFFFLESRNEKVLFYQAGWLGKYEVIHRSNVSLSKFVINSTDKRHPSTYLPIYSLPQLFELHCL